MSVPAARASTHADAWTQEGAGKPTADEMAAVARVAPLTNLMRVQLVAISAQRVASQPVGVPLRGGITSTGRAELQDKKLIASLRFTYKTEPQTMDAEVSFAVAYSLTGDVSLEDARAFSKVNALFNTWPYVREALQNMAVRLGAPVPQVPLLKIR